MKKGDHWALMANFWEKKASKCAKSQTMYDNLILKNRGNLISLQFIHVIQAILLLYGWFFCHILSLALSSTTILWVFSGVERSQEKYLFLPWHNPGLGPSNKKTKSYTWFLPYLKGWRYPIALLRLICFTLNFTGSFRKKKRVSNLSQYTLTTTYMAAGYFFS